MRDTNKVITTELIETFVQGHTFTKSRTHAYRAERIDDLWKMSDAPRKNAAMYRKQEWIAYGQLPKAVHSVVSHRSQGRYFLSVLIDRGASLEETRDAYKALGYKLLSSEFLFSHQLSRIPRRESPAEIRVMRTTNDAMLYAAEARMRLMPEEFLSPNSVWRHYLAWVDKKIVGWVSSIRTTTGRNWVSNLVVRESFRRQGIGSALLATMLRDDRKLGAQGSVLLASHTGALVYPGLGYQERGTLLILAQRRTK